MNNTNQQQGRFHNNLLLASASPRRRELLTQVGIEFELVSVDTDETPLAGERPDHYVVRVARQKAEAGRALHLADPRPVLGADTAVVIDGAILGKPTGEQHAAEMLTRLSGCTHQVISVVALAWGGGPAGQLTTGISISEVTFRQITRAEIAAYWQTGEPQGKAGGYAIQGIAAGFIKHLSGSYSGVMGLPLFETVQLLQGNL